MSDDYLRFIPIDPTYVPNAEARSEAVALLRMLAPRADEVTATVTDEVGFVDPGGNFESVSCPACGREVTSWWNDAISRAWETRFADLSATLPCCGLETSPNDRRYEWPAGFAGFVLEVRNPWIAGPELPAEAIERLERTLGCRLRRIWAHY